ncbi:unnamed protein product [Mytilus coruscus]|uniref:Reverse transcriptase domain-containing protein n=1 Tax=Mytilus coruscus TaxID=42192 RepID=A0A6J8DRL1_MYTCO|nr:unnamed protein product [Mytilus coruscus]
MENTRKPNIIFVEVDNLDNKRAILKAKAMLRNTNKYRDVYIENNIPREKRMLDFNNRTILRAMANGYGELFSEFLSTVNCCVLNGRYPIHDDFTYVSTKGSTVVDYCVVPYESLCHYKNFKFTRASVLCNKSAQPGSFSLNHIPDHSVLCWEFETNFDTINEISSINLSHNAHNSMNQQKNIYVSYDVKNIPNNWMTNNDILYKINMCINNIQCSKGRQFEVDKLYDNIVEILHSEMNDKLESKGSLKQQLRKHFVDKRKDFDKLTQKYKRQYWYRCQEELVNYSDNDQNQFWLRIGQNGLGNERQMRIPNEVTLDDGTITNNLETILSKWKSSFHSLLNPNVNAEYNKVENCNIKENIICIDLDKDITIDEVHKVEMNAKNCKSAGIDRIQAELCKNISIISILHKLYNLCFSSGNVPNMWNKGIIIPIPKCSTSDPRDPLSYRGITLAPFAYKMYCGILNERLVKWLDEREIIYDEQNSFMKGKSSIDHISTITSIIETRKKCKLSTYVAFIDFKKAYDSINRVFLFNKLENLGISSKFMYSLKALYSNVDSSVRPSQYLMTDRLITPVQSLCEAGWIDTTSSVIM